MSVSSVSRAFQPNSRIADSSRKIVLKRAAELGYRANPFARGLVGKKNSIVGVLVSRISSPFYSEILNLLAHRLSKNNMTLMLVASEHVHEIQDGIDMLMAYEPIALLVISSYASADSIAKASVPHEKIVYFNRPPKRAGSLGVIFDNFTGGKHVAEFLVGLGHRRLVYLSSGLDSFTDHERQRGFATYCAAHDIAPPRIIKANGFTYEAGMACAEQIAALLPEIDAVFCAADLLGLGLLDGLRHHCGVEIPRQLSVVGCDDIATASWPSFSLTTLRLPRDAIVNEIVRLIESVVEDRRPETELIQVPPGKIVVRRSTGPRP